MSLIVAGLDPSLRNFAMVKGTIHSTDTSTFLLGPMALQETAATKHKQVRKSSDDLECARLITRTLTEFLADVDLVMVEMPIGSQSASAMKSYGVCMGVLAGIGIPMIQVTPDEVKRAGAGKKTASKAEMIAWAVGQYPDASWLRQKRHGVMELVNKNEHLADAVAAVRAGMATDEYKRMTLVMR